VRQKILHDNAAKLLKLRA